MKESYILIYFSLSLVLFASGREEPPTKALKYLKALQSRPHNEALFLRFYQSWTEEQSANELVEYFSEKEKGWSEWGILAKVQRRMGETNNAIVSLTKAIEVAPDPKGFLLTRAELYLSFNALESAKSDLEAVQGKFEGESALLATSVS